MNDDLDHDAAEELLRQVESRESVGAQKGPSRPPISLPPMDLSFRRKKSTAASEDADAQGQTEKIEKVPDTTFGPDSTAWSKSDTTADTTAPDVPGGISPVDKPRTGMGDFDVVMERDGIVDMVRKRPAILYTAIPVVIAVAAVTVLAFNLGGSGGKTEQIADPGPATAASIQGNIPETYVVPQPSTDGLESNSMEVWGEPEWKSSPEKLFTWYGDGLSEIAASFHPIIGTSDFQYFWKVDNQRSTDQAIRQIDQAVKAETIGDVVVFAYGNNDDVTAVQMNELREAVGDRGLILVGTGASDPRALPWSPQLNGRFQKMAAERPNTIYVDWQSRVTSNPRLVERGFVLTPEGTREWAAMINTAVLEAYR